MLLLLLQSHVSVYNIFEDILKLNEEVFFN
jgi:hypothetical protein